MTNLRPAILSIVLTKSAYNDRHIKLADRHSLLVHHEGLGKVKSAVIRNRRLVTQEQVVAQNHEMDRNRVQPPMAPGPVRLSVTRGLCSEILLEPTTSLIFNISS